MKQGLIEADARAKDEISASPVESTIPSVEDRISPPADPIPYYATPKIMVHKPSQSSQSDRSGPRTIDEVLARERELPNTEKRPEIPKQPSEAPVSSIIPQLRDTPTGKGVHKIVKVRRRSLFLRKARNIAARPTILKATLGRQLAVPTKEALRELAHKTVVEDPFIGSESLVLSPTEPAD